MSYRSGWLDLLKTYPDRGEPVSAQFRGQSGSLNGISLQRILRLADSPAGLRLGMLRLFGPFNRDLCVSWRVSAATRTQRPLVGKVALLALGQPAIAVPVLPADVADDLARTLPHHWPEAGAFPLETARQVGGRILQQWALQTTLAVTFFIVAPRLMLPQATPPPTAVGVLFPAAVFVAASLIRYWRRRRGGRRPR